MKTCQFFTAMLIFCTISLFGQDKSPDLESLHQQYKSFDYAGAIQNADRLLQQKSNLPLQETIFIYQIRAQSHYALMHMDQALKDFIEVLNLDPDFSPDPKTTSPKIITFFNEIKNSVQEKEQIKEPVNTPVQIQTVTDTVVQVFDNTRQITSCLKRSLMFPGWGHIYNGQKKKGWLLAGVNTVTFTAALYTIQDCSNTRKDYLSETSSVMLKEKYNSYNSSYKNRNMMIALYAAFWIYTQSDLLWFTDFPNSAEKSLTVLPNWGPEGSTQITFCFQW